MSRKTEMRRASLLAEDRRASAVESRPATRMRSFVVAPGGAGMMSWSKGN